MDSQLPHCKVRKTTSNDFQKSYMNLDNNQTAPVVSTEDITAALQNTTTNGENESQYDFNDMQSIFPNINHIGNIKNSLHKMLKENVKLKKTLEGSDAVMKEQFEKLDLWQKEVMSSCRIYVQKYKETKTLVDQLIKNDFLRGMIQDELKNYAVQQSPMNTNFVNVKIEPNTLNTFPDISESTNNEQSVMTHPPQVTKTQAVSMEIESVTTCSHTPTNEIQRTNVKTKMRSGDNLRDRKALLLAKLEEIMTEIQTLDEREENVADERKDEDRVQDENKLSLEKEVLLLKDNCDKLTKELEDVKAEKEALRVKKNISLHERQSFDELKRLYDDATKTYEQQYEHMQKMNILLKSECSTLKTDLNKIRLKHVNSLGKITNLRKQIVQLQNAQPLTNNKNKQNKLKKKLNEELGGTSNIANSTKPQGIQPKEQVITEAFPMDQSVSLTPEYITNFVNYVRGLKNVTQEKLESYINFVHEKALNDPSCAVSCAFICKELSNVKVKGTNIDNSNSIDFRKLLITRCQLEFENNNGNVSRIDQDKIRECTDQEKKVKLQRKFEQQERRMHQRSVGNIQLIGELFKQNVLSSKIMCQCIRNLLTHVNGKNLECLCILLTSIGRILEAKKINLSNYFEQMQQIVTKDDNLDFKIRLMLHNVIILRMTKWIPRKNSGYSMTVDLY